MLGIPIVKPYCTEPDGAIDARFWTPQIALSIAAKRENTVRNIPSAKREQVLAGGANMPYSTQIGLRQMSALGHEQTREPGQEMSALHLEADIL